MVQRQKVILRFNYRNGFRALRTDPGVVADIMERAQRVADAAGDGVEVIAPAVPYSRARALVGPVTGDAARRVATENTLLRALEAGRG